QRRQPRHVGQLRLGLAQGCLGALALDELANLVADGCHRMEQVLVRLPDLLAEELHDPQDVAAEQDGKAESRVQSFACSDERAGEVRVVDDMWNVGGNPAGTDDEEETDVEVVHAGGAGGWKVGV